MISQALPKFSLRDGQREPCGWICKGVKIASLSPEWAIEKDLGDKGSKQGNLQQHNSDFVTCFSRLLINLVMTEVNLLLPFISLRCELFSLNICTADTVFIHCLVRFIISIHFH